MGRVSEAAALTLQSWGRKVNAKKSLRVKMEQRICEEEALEEMARQRAARRSKRQAMSGRVALVSMLAVVAVAAVSFVTPSAKPTLVVMTESDSGIANNMKQEPKEEMFAGGSATLTRLASSFISEQMNVKHSFRNVEALDYV